MNFDPRSSFDPAFTGQWSSPRVPPISRLPMTECCRSSAEAAHHKLSPFHTRGRGGRCVAAEWRVIVRRDRRVTCKQTYNQHTARRTPGHRDKRGTGQAHARGRLLNEKGWGCKGGRVDTAVTIRYGLSPLSLVSSPKRNLPVGGY